MRIQTFDKPSAFWAPQALGKSRRMTPEGFLLCEGVPVARTGVQLYSAKELGLPGDPMRVIRIERTADEVFKPESLASYNGKPFTLHHPGEFVTAENWHQLAKGTAHNARRGEGLESDCVVADLLITEAHAIKYVNDELPQVSAGYEAEYDMLDDSHGIQRNIIVNHIAGVKHGRAGSRCAIKDGEPDMKDKPLLTRILTTFGVKDPEAAAEVIANASGPGPQQTTDAAAGSAIVTTLQTDVATLKTDLAEIKKLLTKDAKTPEQVAAEAAAAAAATKRFTDADATTAISRAEILAPGITIPTKDSLHTEDGMKAFMVSAIERADASDAGKAHLAPFGGAQAVKALTLDALSGVFIGAAELARLKNSSTASTPNPFTMANNVFVSATKDGKPRTMADQLRDQQKANDDFWSKQRAS